MAERCFSRKTSQPGIQRIRGGLIGTNLSHSVVIELFAEILVKCELKPVEDLKDIHIESNRQHVYSSMLIFQSQRSCSEVSSA